MLADIDEQFINIAQDIVKKTAKEQLDFAERWENQDKTRRQVFLARVSSYFIPTVDFLIPFEVGASQRAGLYFPALRRTVAHRCFDQEAPASKLQVPS